MSRPSKHYQASLDAQAKALDPVTHLAPPPERVLRDPLAVTAGLTLVERVHHAAGVAREHGQRHRAYALRAELERDDRLAAGHAELARVHDGYAEAFVQLARLITDAAAADQASRQSRGTR